MNHVLSVKLGPGRRELTLKIPEAEILPCLQSLTSASPAHRRVLVRGYLSAYAGPALSSWAWLGSPAERFDRQAEQAQADIVADFIAALQQLAPTQKAARRHAGDVH